MKKYIIIGAVIVLLIIGGWLFLAHGNASPSINSITAQSAAKSDSLGPIYHVPSSTTIVLGATKGSVTINNFYKEALGSQDQFIVIAQNSNYEITYDTDTNVFYLSIANSSADANQIQAENAFMTILGITQADACRLNVEEGFTQGFSTKNTQLGLSFCSSGGAFQEK